MEGDRFNETNDKIVQTILMQEKVITRIKEKQGVVLLQTTLQMNILVILLLFKGRHLRPKNTDKNVTEKPLVREWFVVSQTNFVKISRKTRDTSVVQ